MRYHQFIKKLDLPSRFDAPPRLTYQDIVAVAITRAHLQDDVRGINASIELIQSTRGGDWPTEAVTEEFNFVDLVWHEQEFREKTSFTYAVYDDRGHYLGCCYLYPMGRRTELTEKLLDHDVDVSWWVTPAAYQGGYYDKLYAALQDWLASEFPFSHPYYPTPQSRPRRRQPRGVRRSRAASVRSVSTRSPAHRPTLKGTPFAAPNAGRPRPVTRLAHRCTAGYVRLASAVRSCMGRVGTRGRLGGSRQRCRPPLSYRSARGPD